MDLIRCVDCQHFQPDPASLRMGKCLHQEPWDGSADQFARDDHECANFASSGGRRHISAEEEEKLKKFPGY
jgi:hypothetical protein